MQWRRHRPCSRVPLAAGGAARAPRAMRASTPGQTRRDRRTAPARLIRASRDALGRRRSAPDPAEIHLEPQRRLECSASSPAEQGAEGLAAAALRLDEEERDPPLGFDRMRHVGRDKNDGARDQAVGRADRDASAGGHPELACVVRVHPVRARLPLRQDVECPEAGALPEDDQPVARHPSPPSRLAAPPIARIRLADDPRAAELGRALFFDTRLSADGGFPAAPAPCWNGSSRTTGRSRTAWDARPPDDTARRHGVCPVPVLGRAQGEPVGAGARPIASPVEHGGDRTQYAQAITEH